MPEFMKTLKKNRLPTHKPSLLTQHTAGRPVTCMLGAALWVEAEERHWTLIPLYTCVGWATPAGSRRMMSQSQKKTMV